MKKNIVFFLFFVSFHLAAQSILGTWKSIDDVTGEPKSHIQIYRNSQGKVEGRIVKILVKKKQNARCTHCKGKKKNQPYLGLVILEDLEGEPKVTNPDNGKVYDCSVELMSENKLKLRGYLGSPVLGKTQIWERLK